jgi:rfaE bifunctional protein nucleotidyltransferase chain/domain
MRVPAKVTTINALLKHYGPRAKRGVRIAVCNGSFDLLHAGHISFLKEARSHGDVLVVLLNTDASIALYKGPSRPIASFSERATILDALPFVDHIVPLTALNPISLIETLEPEVFCNGSDWGRFAIERSVVENYGGTFIIVSAKTRANMSSSDLVSRAARAYQTVSPQALFIEYQTLTTLIQDNRTNLEILTQIRDAGWYVFITEHAEVVSPKTLARKLATRSVTKHLVQDVFSTTKKITARDTTLFREAAQKYHVALSRCWHITNTTHGTSNARCANMKTAQLGIIIPKKVSTLERPNTTVASLDELLPHLGLMKNSRHDR